MASETESSILVINPNTSSDMTEALKPILTALEIPQIRFGFFTAPANESVTLPDGRILHGVPSIDSTEDAARSALHCWPFVKELMPEYDAFLVACYSAHPLASMLRDEIDRTYHAVAYESSLSREAAPNGHHSTSRNSTSKTMRRRKFVMGIFEASIIESLALTNGGLGNYPNNPNFDVPAVATDEIFDMFGIVSTGKIWEAELSKAVRDLAREAAHDDNNTVAADADGWPSLAGSRDHRRRFAGVETTGLTAVQLHRTPADEVKKRMVEATERLLRQSARSVGVVCLGCAGMAGMDEAVREGCVRAYGDQRGNQVRIIDGVVAGAAILAECCSQKGWTTAGILTRKP